MATISSAGIGSGLDVDGIVTKLMAVEKRPLTSLQTKASTIDSKISAFGTIKSQLSSLSDAAGALAKAAIWDGKTAATVLGVAGGAFAGNAIEKNMKKVTVYEVRVRMDDGSVRNMELSSAVAVGSKVIVEGKNLRLA